MNLAWNLYLLQKVEFCFVHAARLIARMAATSAAVFILYRGFKERVVFPSSSPLFCAIEAFCGPRGMDASRHRLVTDKGKPVDLGIPFAHSSVSTNCTLELEEIAASAGSSAASSAAADVRLVVTLAPVPPGAPTSTVDASYASSTTVADVVLDLAARGALGPALASPSASESLKSTSFLGCSAVYVRRAVKGPDMSSTTLRALGLVKGTAALRLSVPAPATSDAAASAVSPRSDTAVSAASASLAHSLAAVPSVGASAAEALSALDSAATPAAGLVAPAEPNADEPAAKRARGLEADAGGEGGTHADGGVAVHSEATATPAAAKATVSSPVAPDAAASVAASNTAASSASAVMPIASSAPMTSVPVTAAPTTAVPTQLLQPATGASTGAGAAAAAATGTHLRLRHASQRAGGAIHRLRAAAFDADSSVALSTVLSILDNLIRQPGQPRVRCLRLANPKFAQAVGRWPAAVEILKAAGFEEVDETAAPWAGGAGSGAGMGTTRVLLLREAAEDDDLTLTVREAVAAAITAMGPAVPPPPPAPSVDYAAREAAAAAAAAVQASFDPFRPMVLRPTGEAEAIGAAPAPAAAAAIAGSATSAPAVGGAGAGAGAGARTASAPSSASLPASSSDSAPASLREMTSTDRQVASLKASARELQASNRPPAHRCTRVALYNPHAQAEADAAARAGRDASAGGVSGSGAGLGVGLVGVRESKRSEADDDAPDAEASALMAEYARKKMVEARDAGDKPLMTAAQRQLEALKTARVFTSTSIKVQLPDRSVATGVFSPLDTLADVYAWLKSGAVLSPLACALPFYLFSTPPPQQHKDDPTLTLADAKLVPSKHLHLAFGSGVGARLTPGSRVPAPAGWTAGAGAGASSGSAVSAAAAVDADGTIAVPSSADELLSASALQAAMDAAGGDDGDGGAGAAGAGSLGMGGAIPLSHASRPAAVAAAVAHGASSGGGAAGSGSDAGLAIDDAELDKMAAQLLAGGGMGGMAGLGALRPAAASSSGAASGGAGSSSSGAPSKGKPSWLRI